MVAEFFKVSKPMVASMISNLSKAGYIIKVSSTEDKRSFTLSPTAKAVSLVETTYGEYIKTMQLLADGLGHEKLMCLIELLEQANDILIGGND
jgi:DNA-binding MarR family transcriptional regulator